MCVEVVLHSVCFEMYVTRVYTYFITWTCISLTACMDGWIGEEGGCCVDDIPRGMLVNPVKLFLHKRNPPPIEFVLAKMMLIQKANSKNCIQTENKMAD